MKTITLTDPTTRADELFQLADDQNVVVRTIEGKIFVIAALGTDSDADDFADEIVATQQNESLMALLRERAHDTSRIPAADARKRLGL